MSKYPLKLTKWIITEVVARKKNEIKKIMLM